MTKNFQRKDAKHAKDRNALRNSAIFAPLRLNSYWICRKILDEKKMQTA